MKVVRWFILFWPGIISAQWSFDFEENLMDQWGQSPESRWEISSVSPLNGLYSLHHSYDNPGSGEDFAFVNLNYPRLDSSLSFSFRIRHAYNPSSGNNWQVYFLSEQAGQIDNAFVFGVNYKGSDDRIKLWQVVDGLPTEIVISEIDYEEHIGRSNAPRFLVSRDPSGIWKVSMDVEGNDTQLTIIGEGEEISRSEGKFLGIRYCYSSAQDRKLWLDDVIAEGVFYEDNDPPKLDSIEVMGMNSLYLWFSESVAIDGESDFQWSGFSPDSINVKGSEIQLFFPGKFPNREEQNLDIGRILDLEGNRMNDTLAVFMQKLFEYGEIVINEIMSDPEPEVYLPACEYIELFNLTDYDLDISGWTLMVNAKNYPIEHAVIPPREYLLLTSQDQYCRFEGIPLVQVFTSSTSLTNSGATLKLFDQYHRLIHFAEYREISFYDQMKREGGWSLEMIDPGLACGKLQNWSVSSDDSGGTPGKRNSVYSKRQDLTPPELTYLGLADKNTIVLNFSEPVYLTEENIPQVTIGNLGAATPVFHTSPLVSEMIEFSIHKDFLNETIYLVNISEISDCEGNIMKDMEVKFALPSYPNPGLVLFNEVMYDAFIGQQEYLELYNTSESYIDLKDLKLAANSNAYPLKSFSWVSEESHLFPPGAFIALTKNEIALRENWDLSFAVDVLELPNWKTLPNSAGSISLLNRSEKILENFYYSDSMHHRLLKNPSGVSLERVSGNLSTSIWTSASSSVNYGTPGTRNSQWKAESSEQGDIIINPLVFSPDMDGYEDVCEIILKDTPVGSLINIYVTDLHGVEVTKLIENGISGGDDHYYWDGHDMTHTLVLPGIYVIHIRVSGDKREKVYRKSCAVSYR